MGTEEIDSQEENKFEGLSNPAGFIVYAVRCSSRRQAYPVASRDLSPRDVKGLVCADFIMCNKQ